MAGLLAAVGIKTKYVQIDPATVIDELYRNGNYDLIFANFGPYQSMEDNWKYIKCGWGYDDGGFNYARYCNEELDTAWQAALDEPDPEAQHQMWNDVSLMLGENPPQATVWRQSITYVWSTERARRLSLPVPPAGPPGLRKGLARED